MLEISKTLHAKNTKNFARKKYLKLCTQKYLKLCMQEIPVQSQDRDPDGVLDKLYVVHQLVAVEENDQNTNSKDGFFVK